MIIKFHNDPLFVSESINKIISNSSRDSELDILFVSHDDPLRCTDSKESPFSVTKVSLNGIYHIVYNKIIKRLSGLVFILKFSKSYVNYI